MLKQILKGVGKGWRKVLNGGKTAKPLLREIIDELDEIEEKTLCPKPSEIFNAFKFPIDKCSVVIIGQDPYHTPGVAHGLAFSCRKGPIPKSLSKIFKALVKSKLASGKPDHANLSAWRDQGVLLLNAALTTLVGKPNAHAKLWKNYVEQIILRLNKYMENKGTKLIYMLWGNNAKKIKTSDMHRLEWGHPIGVYSDSKPNAFNFCDHFTKANEILVARGENKINWNFCISGDIHDFNDDISIEAAESKHAVSDVDDFISGKDPFTSLIEVDSDAESGKDDDVNNENKMCDKNKKRTKNSKFATIKGKNKGTNQVDELAGFFAKPRTDLSSREEKNRELRLRLSDIQDTDLVVFTDGACPNNGSKSKNKPAIGGYAAVFVDGLYNNREIVGRLPMTPKPTNNLAEGAAIEETLKYAKKKFEKWDRLIIVTDSGFWLDMINKYMEHWDSDKFKSHKNERMTRSIWKLWSSMRVEKDLYICHTRRATKSGWKNKPKGSIERYCYDNNDYADELAKYSVGRNPDGKFTYKPGEMVVSRSR
jgi:uracil-DNA glycosylase